MENPIKMDDLGVPLFLEPPKWKKLPHMKGKKQVEGTIFHWTIDYGRKGKSHFFERMVIWIFFQNPKELQNSY